MANIPKIVFIVPYRNRKLEKTHYSIYMKYIMEDYNQNDYEIYYSHQTDSRPFNRGATKNIGFVAIKNKYPDNYKNITFVFNDIDTLPIIKNTFNYITTKGTVKHFYGVNFALGGIFSVIGEDFEKCNGFPNNWGWGLEDNEIQNRVISNNIIIDRTEFYAMNSKEIIQIKNGPNRLINNRDPSNYIQHKLVDNLDTINDLKYTIEPNVENSTFTPDNQYMINITKFNTLINPANEVFYNQNTFYNSRLRPFQYERNINNDRWSIKNLLNK